MSHVKLNDICLSYGDCQLFDGLSLEVPARQFTAFVGPNGSGKSSLLRIIAGLQSPSAGDISLMNRPLATYRVAELAQIRAFMPQHTIIPEAMTVRQLVKCGRYAYQGLFAIANKEDEHAVEWAMSVCGVTNFHNTQLSEMSGGEQQRAWLASALGQKAPILLLDEPCSYLDISYQIELMQLLRDLVDHEGLTVVMSSHDIAQSAQYADHLIAMKNGRLMAEGPVDQTLTADLIKKLFNVNTEFHTSAVTGRSHCIFHASDKASPYSAHS